MSKHTDGAVRAADKIVDFLGIPHREPFLEYQRNAKIAAIIDREIGLPEKEARIEELEKELLTLITFSADLQQRLEAEKAELVETLTDLIPYINECEMAKQIYRTQAQAIREVVAAAIAKAEPTTTTNPKPEEPQ